MYESGTGKGITGRFPWYYGRGVSGQTNIIAKLTKDLYHVNHQIQIWLWKISMVQCKTAVTAISGKCMNFTSIPGIRAL